MKVQVNRHLAAKWIAAYAFWCGAVAIMALVRRDLNPSVDSVMVLFLLPLPAMALLAILHLAVAAAALRGRPRKPRHRRLSRLL
jgi:hypothetical protein